MYLEPLADFFHCMGLSHVDRPGMKHTQVAQICARDWNSRLLQGGRNLFPEIRETQGFQQISLFKRIQAVGKFTTDFVELKC